ncbi:27080_t:CDS:2 [Gigaspora margarita]|uniref:27080_t:CDS:1 n=1 Tax=Gigaspora margarita TaxID=4874 RepID=A0ABN7UF72_GIGMA|nr:27080_t:CDS:2 [Gigaspora margarita]
MNFVENPLQKLRREAKWRYRNFNGRYEDHERREHVKKEGPIYSYDELREVFQANKCLGNFLDQLHLAARPLERSEKTIDRMKKLIVHICYLLASLNNSKINSFNSSGDGINTYKLPSLGYEITDRHLPRDYLCNEIKINVEALKVSIMKDLGENEFIEEQTEGTDDNESDDAKAVVGEIEIENNLLENAKKTFLNI